MCVFARWSILRSSKVVTMRQKSTQLIHHRYTFLLHFNFFFTSLLSSLLQSVWFPSNDRAKTRLQLKNRETREMGFRKKRKCRQCEMLFFSQIVWICDAASAMNLNVIFLHYFSRIKITETLAAFRWAVFPVLLPIVLFLIPLTAFSWISVLRVRLLLLFSMSYT